MPKIWHKNDVKSYQLFQIFEWHFQNSKTHILDTRSITCIHMYTLKTIAQVILKRHIYQIDTKNWFHDFFLEIPVGGSNFGNYKSYTSDRLKNYIPYTYTEIVTHNHVI